VVKIGVGGGGFGVLVQADVCGPDLAQDIDLGTVGLTHPRFLNDAVPEGTEVVLEFRTGIAHVKVGEGVQDEWCPGAGTKGFASHVDQEGKQRAVAVRDVVPKHTVWNAKFILSQLDPPVIAPPNVYNNLGDNPPYVVGNVRVGVTVDVVLLAPTPERLCGFNGLKQLAPPTVENLAKDFGNATGTEYCMGSTQTGSELIASGRFGYGIGRESAVQEFIQHGLELAP
jgi:hypothetical protein